MTNRNPTPKRWGDDTLSDYFTSAESNGYATFMRLNASFQHLAKLDALFLRAMEHLNNTEKWFLLFFVGRSFSAFRVSARLAISGSMIESYVTQRSAIEFALYALHIDSNSQLAEVWLKRDDGHTESKLVRKEFQHINIMKTAQKRLSKNLYNDYLRMYEWSITQGAHPNVTGVLLGSDFSSDKVGSIHLQADEARIKMVIKDTCRVGIIVLRCFNEIFKIRFELAGLDKEIERAGVGL